MSLRKLLVVLATGSMTVLAAPAMAQDAVGIEERKADSRTSDEDTIVVRGEREKAVRQAVRERGDRALRDSQIVGAMNSDGGAANFGKEQIDWQRVFFARQMETNSPLARYAHAFRMASCALTSVGEDAAAYVETDGGPEWAKVTEAFRGQHRQCVESAARGAPAMMVNAALAEMLVMRFVDEPPLRALGVNADEAEDFIRGNHAEIVDSDLATVGRCLAVFAPGYSYDLLFTNPGSRDEKKALETLYRNAPECGVAETPKGISPVYQRTSVAMGLFAWYGLARS